MTNVTFVTALYDINREKIGDGRKFSEYLDWLDKLLKIKVPLVIFTSDEINEFINQRRNNKIIIINQKLEDLYYYQFKKDIEQIIQSKEYRFKIAHPNRVECINPLYNVIQYNKFDLLKKVSDENPFQTKMFFWVDVGISRFFEGFDLNKEYIISSKYPEDKFIIQGRYDYENYTIDDKFYWNSCNLFIGTMFGGDRKTLHKMFNLILHEMKWMIQNKQMNNEQLAIAKVWSNNKDLFYIFKNQTYRHLPLFEYLSE